jgi:hypothetical protein
MPKNTTYKAGDSDAEAIHVSSGKQHLVGLGSIRVLICPDGDCWFAQGVEIDYAAQGASIEDVKKRFEVGLRATIEENLKIYDSIDGLLAFAPS